MNDQQQTAVTNQQSAQQKQQLAVQKQFAMRKQQMDKAKMQAKQQGKLPVNAESLDAKIASLVSAKISTLSERADFWHPDPAQDRRLGGPGANQRAREDGAAASKSASKSDNKLRPGESYMQYAKRKAAERTQKEEVCGGVKKGGSYAKGYAAMQKEIDKLDKGKEPSTAKRYREMKKATGVSESRRMDREGVAREPDEIRDGRAERAKKSLEAVKKGDKRVEKYVKKYGTTPSKDTAERRNLKMMHPGSRQEPKVKGEKETALQTHNRRVNRHNERLIKHGSTAKEKKSAAGYAEYEKQYKSQYGQHKSAWD